MVTIVGARELNLLLPGSIEPALPEDKSKRDLLKPEIIYEIESGLALSATQVYEASVVRSNWFQYFLLDHFALL